MAPLETISPRKVAGMADIFIKLYVQQFYFNLVSVHTILSLHICLSQPFLYLFAGAGSIYGGDAGKFFMIDLLMEVCM